MPITLDDLRTDTTVQDLLAEHFDLGVFAQMRSIDGCTVEGCPMPEAFAREGAGGMFGLIADGSVLYIDSEGKAGVVAASLVEFLELVVDHPYWQSILKFSDGGRLDEMRHAADRLELDLQDEETEVDEARDTLRAALGLGGGSDAVARLHAAVRAGNERIVVRAADGSAYGSLFGDFRVQDNPFWRVG
jgi:hypothetical protein